MVFWGEAGDAGVTAACTAWAGAAAITAGAGASSPGPLFVVAWLIGFQGIFHEMNHFGERVVI